MKERVKSLISSTLFKDFAIFSFGALLLRGVSFFLLPVYTRYLSPEEFGRLDVISTVSNTIEIVLSLGLLQILQVDFYSIDEGKRGVFIKKLLRLYSIISTPIYIGICVVLFFIGDLFNSDFKLLLIALALSTSYLNFFQGMYFILLRFNNRVQLLTKIQVTIGIVAILLNVFFVVFLSIGISGILLSNVVVALVSNLLFLSGSGLTYSIENKNEQSPTFSSKYLLRTGTSFIPNILLLWLLNTISRWTTLAVSDVETIGLYSVAFRFSSMLDPLIIQPFLSAFTPKELKKHTEGNYKPLDFKWVILIPFLFLLIGLILSVLGYFLLDNRFHNCLPFIPILTCASSFGLLAQIQSVFLNFKKKAAFLAFSLLIGLIISTISSFILIPILGGIGAALSTFSGTLAWFTAINYFNKKVKQSTIFE